MSDQEGLAEIVVLFEEDGSCIDTEMLFSDFNALAEGSPAGESKVLDRHASSEVCAVYVLVGTGLAVRALVFFRFRVDENGQMVEGFNLPLQYLMEQAGQGPDLGMGAVRMASKSQCPVPWHAVHLWEPRGEGEENSAVIVQKAVWRNRLSLKAVGTALPTAPNIELVAYGDETPIMPDHHALQTKLTETFGEDGTVDAQHLISQQNQQLAKISEKFRTDLEEQQQTYLSQIRGHKDEIQKLKSLLRNEKERSRRLQSMLRGDV